MKRAAKKGTPQAHEYRRQARRGASTAAERTVYQFTADDMQQMRQSMTSIAHAMMTFGAKLHRITLREYIERHHPEYVTDPDLRDLFDGVLATEKGGA